MLPSNIFPKRVVTLPSNIFPKIETSQDSYTFNKYLNYYGLSDLKDKINYLDTTPIGSFYAADPFSKNKYLGLPFDKIDSYKGILAHELGHATSPIMDYFSNNPLIGIPALVGGKISYLLSTALGAAALSKALHTRTLNNADVLANINRIRDASNLGMLPSNVSVRALDDVVSQEKSLSKLTGLLRHKPVLYAALATYAPTFIEETSANLRAAKALFKNEDIVDALTNLPQLLSSQAIYTLPVALAIMAHRSYRPVPGSYTLKNRLAQMLSATKQHIETGGSLKNILKTIKLQDDILKATAGL